MVSIIIPLYNVSPYLRKCLDSVLAQTCPDWEAILVDDASDDDSCSIAEEYCGRDNRFHLFRQEKNMGQSAARNRGLDNAKGEFIAFLDADDWWDSDYLEKHLNGIDGFDLVQSGFRRVSGDEPVRTERPLHKWRFTSAWMRLYRRRAIGSMRFTEGHRYEDVLWTVDMLLSRPSIRLIRYTGYNYRKNPNSTTSVLHKDDFRFVMEELCKRGMYPVVIYTILKMRLHFLFKRPCKYE